MPFDGKYMRSYLMAVVVFALSLTVLPIWEHTFTQKWAHTLMDTHTHAHTRTHTHAHTNIQTAKSAMHCRFSPKD